jgi:alpha-1,3-rhamnosyl/mannosyltransferase
VEPRKNIVRLIDAFEMLPVALKKKYPLVIAGFSGWKSEDIHKCISRAAQDGFVRYIGYVPEKAMPALYGGCRAFLYPSLYEGFGLPLLEAMSCGAPVMTSNCSCMPEVAGNAALLVDPLDLSSISAGIEKALSDEKWRSCAINLGLERARAMTWDATVRKTVEVYRRVLNQ